MKKIQIILDKNGGIKVETSGYQGEICLEKVKFLKELFGEASETKLKSEYFEKEQQENCFDVNGLPSGWCG